MLLPLFLFRTFHLLVDVCIDRTVLLCSSIQIRAAISFSAPGIRIVPLVLLAMLWPSFQGTDSPFSI
jgi:hypothetical protein